MAELRSDIDDFTRRDLAFYLAIVRNRIEKEGLLVRGSWF